MFLMAFCDLAVDTRFYRGGILARYLTKYTHQVALLHLWWRSRLKTQPNLSLLFLQICHAILASELCLFLGSKIHRLGWGDVFVLRRLYEDWMLDVDSD